MLNLNTKIALANTDPTFSRTMNGAPLPADDHLYSRLGNDYKVYLSMRRDCHIRSQLQKRRQAILGRDVVIETPDEEQTETEILGVTKVKKLLSRMRFESLCSNLLETGQLIGFAVAQIDWRLVDDLVVPFSKPVPQERFVFAAHDPDAKGVPSVGGGELDPNAEIVMVGDYELRLLTLANPFNGERCPKGRFVVYTFDGDGSPNGLGLGYSLYPWYLIKKESMKAWLLHSDRLGSPPVIGNHPAEINEKKEEYRDVIRKFEDFLKSISPNGWARLPDGFDAKLLDSIGTAGPETHKQLISTANEEISRVILGEVAFSDKSFGSQAANTSQVADREAGLIDADVNLLDEQLDAQLWSKARELNYKNVEITVRRETIADSRKQLRETQKKEALTATAARDDILINSLNLEPEPEYIKRTYGNGWRLKGVALTPQAIAPATPTADFANLNRDALGRFAHGTSGAIRKAVTRDALIDTGIAVAGTIGGKIGEHLGGGEIGALAGDLIGSLAARQAVKVTQAALAAKDKLSRDDAYQRAGRFEKMKRLSKATISEFGSASFQHHMGNELTGDISGWAIGNGSAMLLKHVPGIGGIPFVGAGVAMATVPRVTAIRQKVSTATAISYGEGNMPEFSSYEEIRNEITTIRASLQKAIAPAFEATHEGTLSEIGEFDVDGADMIGIAATSLGSFGFRLTPQECFFQQIAIANNYAADGLVNEGSAVSWPSGDSRNTGRVIKVYPRAINVSLNGVEYARSGSQEDPAILIESNGGGQLLKLFSEVEPVTGIYAETLKGLLGMG